ncbi:Ppx/GppA phosphatase family protein [Aureibacter tunicatorum]|uniref:Exopolyphosphatase/guanosine-5'-triphosphate, 3'-diphosphate pyrophosphatase n=1 Tax=Aureibacter tunicatorum TaxID=866807 RepID=A0AAE3XK51_9BACT|nr:exopolyphosphatase [Aureibacter tunicatorum]MDR6237995.1 exopolyphosphatase/guanosine-5'-triphosphate,3'-diphosphate pyrophosphatase [Aureibacter tunicatorum]BDD03028.1 hypothetical protein AUTU_05110 [Aureibacter tunicatorum]
MGSRRAAIIDLGTNTFNLLIVELKEGSFEIIYTEKIAVRLGHQGISKGIITDEATHRAKETLLYFKQTIDEYKVNSEMVFAGGTSAIRNAQNTENFIQQIKEYTDLDIHVITGEEEASLIYQGVKHALPLYPSLNSLVVDIGGGSVEYIICNNNEIIWKKSIEMGAQRMLDKFHINDPITQNELDELTNYLKEITMPVVEACKANNVRELIGSSGSFDTLAEIYEKQIGKIGDPLRTSYELPASFYYKIHQDLIKKDKDERINIPGMLPMRADMIVVASCLIEYLLNCLNIDHIRVSTYAMKEGLVFKYLEEKH